MKTILVATLLLSAHAFAQKIDLATLKAQMKARKATLEKVHVGMSKKVTTTGKEGECAYKLTSTTSILKIDGEKMIMLSKEKFSPANTAACRAANYTSSSEDSILYYEAKPTVEADIADLDASAANIENIELMGDRLELNMKVTEEGVTEKVTVKYDLSKPSFKNMLSTQSKTFLTVTEDMADIDVSKVDLKNVLFCDDNDGDTAECVEGDFSDILF